MVTLQNDFLRVKIHPKGAELQELVSAETGINYMWSGDPAYWGKFSPVLFPIVGELKDNKYSYNGKQYSLARHGFARDRVFSVEQPDQSSAVFTLNDDAESRMVYPFAFRLQLRYRLLQDQLACSYSVLNTGDDRLWFSVGAHPAFAVPLPINNPGTNYDDYSLVFNRSTELSRFKLKGGLITDTTEKIALKDGRLPLTKSLFAEDALVLKNLPDTEIRLECSKHPHGIKFAWEGFPFFGIWAAPNAPFVCLEPWCGIADHVNHDQQLTTKEGIQSLLPGGEFIRQWQVDCF
ncbi:aldose 1-epimerase family protein [Flavihumibacter profundi]|uniref:aldose 1-epimerase family protein n=1 Tax=Flavihumibacter profundi TaxID=2716883 RepID=UPI001CC71686|nr:aldose 1-epimerase family protein [Flavihumibacter profundi]MBZ5857961.1 aldose 1-epimerase family protein [Flavihumibacter profundi]